MYQDLEQIEDSVSERFASSNSVDLVRRVFYETEPGSEHYRNKELEIDV